MTFSMSYSIETIPSFDRQIKRLAKKYKSVKTDLKNLADQLQEAPELGTALGQNCYKVRLAIKSKGKGKSGGSRLITHVHIAGETVFLLSIYDKSEKANLEEGELDELLNEIDLD